MAPHEIFYSLHDGLKTLGYEVITGEVPGNSKTPFVYLELNGKENLKYVAGGYATLAKVKFEVSCFVDAPKSAEVLALVKSADEFSGKALDDLKRMFGACLEIENETGFGEIGVGANNYYVTTTKVNVFYSPINEG